MKSALATFLLMQVFLLSPFSHAADAREQAWINQLVSEDVSQIRRAAQEITNAGAFDQALLDVVAEVLLETYKDVPSGYIQVDALSYAANALGNSGNTRYRSVLAEVKENAYHKKLRKFANKNMKKLKKDDTVQYQKGGVSLAKLRK